MSFALGTALLAAIGWRLAMAQFTNLSDWIDGIGELTPPGPKALHLR